MPPGTTPHLDGHEEEWAHTSGSDVLPSERHLVTASSFMEVPEVESRDFFLIHGRRRQEGIGLYGLLRAYLSSTRNFAGKVAARPLPRFHSAGEGI